MKRALISDIHGNLEALLAVMSDIDAQGVDEI
ncbi:MAG: metallophosphoesterase, partial [Planctomycetota bacterium]